MSIRYFFKRQSPLRNRVRGIAFLCFILLLYGCGGEEFVDDSVVETTSGVTPNEAIPISTIYFPITLGNRWTYRNPDGSEWSREIAELEVSDAELYHSYRYDSPVKLDSLGSVEYLTYVDRLVRRMNLADINDVVREILLESGDGAKDWGLAMSCFKEEGRKPSCVAKKNIFKPRILAYLFNANTHVVWHSKLTLLQYPLLPNQTYSTLDLRLTGKADESSLSVYIFDYNSDWTILGSTGGDWESVETLAGSFENCLKIQYEAKPTRFTIVDFRKYFPGDGDPYQDAAREAVESELLNELTDLLSNIVTELGLHTMWLAPGIGPVKIETPDGMAELISYQIAPAP